MTTRNRRRRQWQDRTIDETTSEGTQDSSVLLTGDIDDTKGMTLIRMIIGLNVQAAVLNTTGSAAQLMSYGIGMFAQETIGNLGFPEPSVDADIPQTGWLWRTKIIVRQRVDAPAVRMDLDLRSQRKVMYGAPALVIDNDADQGAAFDVRTIGMIRCLYLLE